MSKLELIQMIILSIIILLLIIYYFIKAIKNKWLGQIINTIEEGIKEAEIKYPNGNGQIKKELVMNKVYLKCEELGIPFKLLYTLISKLIDKIIENYNVIKK